MYTNISFSKKSGSTLFFNYSILYNQKFQRFSVLLSRKNYPFRYPFIKIVSRRVCYLRAYIVHICYIKIHFFVPHPRLINPISDIKGSTEIIRKVGEIVVWGRRNEAGNTHAEHSIEIQSSVSQQFLYRFTIPIVFSEKKK